VIAANTKLNHGPRFVADEARTTHVTTCMHDENSHKHMWTGNYAISRLRQGSS
jgi:hypothetical protein